MRARFAFILSLVALATAHGGAPGDSEHVLTIDGVKRTYRLHVPVGYDAAKPWPLVFVLHGMGGNGKGMEALTGMSAKADAEHFIAVYPDAIGSPTRWNAGINPDIPRVPGDDDVKFLTAVIDRLEKELHVDGKRIYVCGFSSGGIMSYRLGAELSGRLAAIGVVSGTIGMKQPDGSVTEIPKPAHPLPVIAFHGEKDTTIYYGGGGKFGDCLAVAQSIAFWVAADHCTPKPRTEQLQNGNLIKEVYEPCERDGEVALLRFKNGTHEWPQPSNGDDFPATNAIWAFFAKHPRP